MKKEDVKELVKEYLALIKRIDQLQKELRVIRNSFGKTADLTVLINKEAPLLEELMGLRRRLGGSKGFSMATVRETLFVL